MSIAFLSANVYTGNPNQPWTSAVLVEKGVIKAVGTDAQIQSQCSDDVERIHLPGRFITPGLVDAHCHMMALGHALLMVDLRGITSLSECRQIISDATRKAEPGQWILGRNWNQNIWEEYRQPNRHDLDQISMNHPILMTRICTHCIWVNSKALEIAGITSNTPDPAGGKIEREDSTGAPSGIIKEAAHIIKEHIPSPGAEASKKAFLRSQELFLKNGITAVHNCETLADYQTIASLEKEGNLNLRVYHLLPPEDLMPFDEWNTNQKHESKMLWHGHTKIFADGSLGACSAYMHAPYMNSDNNCGIACLTLEEMTKHVMKAYLCGRSVAVHAIGDRALTLTLDAIESARSKIPGNRKDRIEHVQLFKPSDLNRMKGLNITVSNQPVAIASDWSVAKRLWGIERCENAYAWKSILDAGVKMIFGSDAPIEPVNPLLGIQAAITRKDWDGRPVGGWFPEQCLTFEDSLKGYFQHAAMISGTGDESGQITTGKNADLTVFDQDLSQMDADHIKDAQVEMTMVNGKIVYQKN